MVLTRTDLILGVDKEGLDLLHGWAERGGGSILGLIPARNYNGCQYTLSEVETGSFFSENEPKLSLFFTAVFGIQGWNCSNPRFYESIETLSRFRKESEGADDFEVIDLGDSSVLCDVVTQERKRRH